MAEGRGPARRALDDRAVLLGHRVEAPERTVDDGAHRDRLHLYSPLADAGEEEDLVDDPHRLIAGLGDPLEHLDGLLLVDVVDIVEEVAGVPLDRPERVLQVVGDGPGEGVELEVAGGQLIVGLAELGGPLLDLSLEVGEEVGVLEGGRHLRGEHLQEREARLVEGAVADRVLEVEDADEPRLVDQRHAEDRSDRALAEVGIVGEVVAVLVDVADHSLAGAGDVVEHRQGERVDVGVDVEVDGGAVAGRSALDGHAPAFVAALEEEATVRAG